MPPETLVAPPTPQTSHQLCAPSLDPPTLRGAGDSEVQRTMLELLNQLDGFEATNKIKVCGCMCGVVGWGWGCSKLELLNQLDGLEATNKIKVCI